jgi:caffeoyl-CoA O-methyltransferase
MDSDTLARLTDYVREVFVPLDARLESLRPASEEAGMPQIHIRPEEGLMLQFLAQLVGASRIVEIGTLAGYSATWLARALPPDGRLITLDINPEHADFAREGFRRAGLDDRITIKVGPALESLREISAEGPFDLVFIDADKDSYPAYLRWSVENVRVGGLVLGHNAFMGGRIVDQKEMKMPAVRQMLEFNRALAEHPDLLATIIPIGDGIAAGIRTG